MGIQLCDMMLHAYCSDKYQYTMAKTFRDCGMDTTTAVFNLFYRKAPDNNNWAVVCGTDEVLEMVAGLGKRPASFFQQFMPGEAYAEFCEYLSTLRFTGEVYAMEEGQIAFPNQPVITVVAPLVEAQILETPMLCIMNHQMAVATKASRVCRATRKPVSEFGSRRAHGPWAAVYGGKAAYIAGCQSSSNVLGTVLFGEPSTGTMAHSFVTAFGCSVEAEYKAFDAYIRSHRGEGLILLIDTYDTLKSGLVNAVNAFHAHGIDDSYRPSYGVRLDSGDLAYLSAKVRTYLDAHGMRECKIFATNGLDEYLITDLERQGACIDAYGVGDTIATSKHNPCFGNVYKLVQIGDSPVLKRSEDKIKLTNPGFQITYRIVAQGEAKADVTCLRGDALALACEAGERIVLRDEQDKTRTTTFEAGTYKALPLQVKMMEGGRRIAPLREISQKRAFYHKNLQQLNPTERRIINPHYHKVDISDQLYDLKMQLLYKIKEALWQKKQTL